MSTKDEIEPNFKMVEERRIPPCWTVDSNFHVRRYILPLASNSKTAANFEAIHRYRWKNFLFILN